MSTENEATKDCKPASHVSHSAASGGLYGLGFLGAAVYFIVHATSFWMGAFGIVKAIFWPAILVYKAFEYLKL